MNCLIKTVDLRAGKLTVLITIWQDDELIIFLFLCLSPLPFPPLTDAIYLALKIHLNITNPQLKFQFLEETVRDGSAAPWRHQSITKRN